MQKRLFKKRTTSFQKRVADEVAKIPRGQTRTYKEIADLIGAPFAFRAVGSALNKNRDPKVPCHRVVRSDGKVGGYRSGTEHKERILRNEGVIL